MKTLPLKALFFVCAMLLCAGCFVKEDRSTCPCRLWVDFSEVDRTVVECADLVIVADDGFVFRKSLEEEDFESGICIMAPRSGVTLGVWSGAGEMLQDGALAIPSGMDCPPVYCHTSIIDTDCEVVGEKVVMRKNHCNMTVNFKNMESGPVRLGFYGNIDGYEMGGSPSVGEFSYSLESPLLEGNKVVLPRQIDNSLRMELVDGFGINRTFAIGEYITESGYDWDSPDLKDVTLDIDIAVTRITIAVQGWDETYSFGVVI